MLIFAINKSFRNWLIGIYSSVAEEWPMCAVAICFIRINFMYDDLFLFMGCFVQNSSKRIGNKRSAPELHSAVLFKPYPVHTHHMHCIGYCMTALNRLPGIVLFCVCGLIL